MSHTSGAHAFPLACSICHAKMQIIAFINDADSVRNIPNHIGESTLLQKIAPEREPPLWKPLAGSVQAENDSEVGQPSPNQNSSSISMSPSDE